MFLYVSTAFKYLYYYCYKTFRRSIIIAVVDSGRLQFVEISIVLRQLELNSGNYSSVYNHLYIIIIIIHDMKYRKILNWQLDNDDLRFLLIL